MRFGQLAPLSPAPDISCLPEEASPAAAATATLSGSPVPDPGRRPCVFADISLTGVPTRQSHALLPATVRSNTRLARNVLRITLHSPMLHGQVLTGPDEFFGLLMPPPGEPFTAPLPCGGCNIRAEVAAMPAAVRPNLRWYTVRSLDVSRGELTFDVATHGVSDPNTPGIGPGLRWCLSAAPGDEAGIWTAYGLWHREYRNQLIVADPSSFPSAISILDFVERFHPAQLSTIHMVVIAENAQDIEHTALNRYAPRLGSARTFFAPAAHFSRAVRHSLTSLQAEEPDFCPDYVWTAGEGGMCKEVRRFAIDAIGLSASQIKWCPYWFLGRARP